MKMASLLPLLVCVAGLLVYALADGKVMAIGHVMFGVGLLAFLIGGAPRQVSV